MKISNRAREIYEEYGHLISFYENRIGLKAASPRGGEGLPMPIISEASALEPQLLALQAEVVAAYEAMTATN